MLEDNNTQVTEEIVLTFILIYSSWNDCIDTGRSIGGYIILGQAGVVDYGSHLPVLLVISTEEPEYISVVVACMKASHKRMLIYDFNYLGTQSYNLNNPICEPSKIIIGSEAAISTSKYNKDTAGNRHIVRR